MATAVRPTRWPSWRVDSEGAVAAGAALVGAELLAGDGRGFVHPLVRAVIAGERTADELALAHARAARLLIERGAPRDRIVAQLLVATPERNPTAGALLREGGQQALRRGAPGPAVRHLRRALEMTPEDASDGLLSELGVALVLDERAEEAVPVLRRARERAKIAWRPAELADLTMKLWIAMLSLGRVEEGIAMIEERSRPSLRINERRA